MGRRLVSRANEDVGMGARGLASMIGRIQTRQQGNFRCTKISLADGKERVARWSLNAGRSPR
jgi:hypothetical protein